jgi:hypothetical protein
MPTAVIVVFFRMSKSFPDTSSLFHYAPNGQEARQIPGPPWTTWTQLCKIRGFHGGGCEECRPLRYKTPVRTSQETHYVSTTESSQLMLSKI